MAEERCPSCRMVLPPGASRCPGCGRTIGEVNRCPSCQAVAAVKPTPDGGYACTACNAPRIFVPGMRVVQDRSLTPGITPTLVPKVKSVAATGGALGLRLFAAIAAVGGLASGTLVAVVASSAIGLALGAGLAGTGLTIAAIAAFLGGRAATRAETLSLTGRELDVLRLAERHGGELYATDVARHLGVSTVEADRLLTSLADGSRVSPEVTPEGLVKYVFREVARRSLAPRVRVASPEEQASEAELVEADAASAKREGERSGE